MDPSWGNVWAAERLANILPHISGGTEHHHISHLQQRGVLCSNVVQYDVQAEHKSCYVSASRQIWTAADLQEHWAEPSLSPAADCHAATVRQPMQHGPDLCSKSLR